MVGRVAKKEERVRDMKTQELQSEVVRELDRLKVALDAVGPIAARGLCPVHDAIVDRMQVLVGIQGMWIAAAIAAVVSPMSTEGEEMLDTVRRLVAAYQKPCPHGAAEFDEVAAVGLSTREVRERWPRVRCDRCGIQYASMAHFVAGDW
jgi:hypothetical protein